MGYPTPIEWTDATYNPVGGCSIESPGCINCYAQQLAGTRLSRHPLYAGTTSPDSGRPIFNGKLTALPDDHETWDFPLTWRGASAPKLGPGMPSLIFAGDMSDIFHHARPLDDIVKVFARAALSPHIVQVLTKRSDRMRALLTERHFRLRVQDAASDLARAISPKILPHLLVDQRWPLQNVWVGVSAERQQEADQRRDDLATLAVAGWLTFVSYEPAVGPVNWDGWQFLAWMISGGESGDRARPSHPDWHRTARDFCAAHGTAFFFKQWGENWPAAFIRRGHDGEIWRAGPDGTEFWRFDELGAGTPEPIWFHAIGKKAAGHLLDGVEHRAFPKIAIAARAGAAA